MSIGKVARNISAGYAGAAVNGATLLILTPLVIRNLGSLEYGLWVTATALGSYFGSLNAGSGAAGVRSVASGAAQRSFEAASRELGSIFRVYCVLGILACGGLITLGFTALSRFGVPAEYQGPMRALMMLIAVNFLVSFPFGLTRSALAGMQCFGLLNSIEIGTALFRLVATAALLAAGMGVVALGVVQLAASVAGHLARWTAIRRLAPELHLTGGKTYEKLVPQAFLFSALSFGYESLRTLFDNADLLILGLLAGPESVAQFAVAATIASFVVKGLQPVSNVLFPLASRAASVEGPSQGRLLAVATRVNLALALPVVTLLMVDGGAFLRLWAGESFASSLPILRALALAALVTAASLAATTLLFGGGRVGVLLGAESWRYVLNLGLVIAGYRLYGLPGAAVGTLAATLGIDAWLMLRRGCPWGGVDARTFVIHSVGAPLLTGLPVVLLMVAWKSWAPDPSLPVLLARCAACLGGFALMYGLSGTFREERRLVVRAWAEVFRMESPGLAPRVRKSPPPIGEVRLREWIFPLAVAALLMAIVWIPYGQGYRLQNDANRFMGLVGKDAIDDNNVYLGLMRQSAEGRVLFTNNFTPEPNPPALFNFLYLALGRISGWTGWSLDLTHRLFGALSILLLTLTTYSFIATAIRRPFYRRFALLLACFGGGFLWASRIILRVTGFNLRPITAWLVEVNLFHAMIVYPHFVFAAALMTGSLALFLKSERVRRYMPAAAAGCVATILAASHAFEAVAFIPIAGAYLVLDGLGQGRMPGASRWKCGALVIGMPVAMLLVNRWMLTMEPVWGDVVTRLSFQTPDPFHLALGLGASFVIAVLTFEGLLRIDRPAGERMAKAWVLMVLVLAYVPFINWRWHLLNGIQIPLSVLATQGLRRTLFRRIQLRRRALRKTRIVPRGLWAPAPQMALMLFVGLVCCLSAANLFLNYEDQVREISSPTYLTRGELKAMDWMSHNVSLEAVVLASYKTGNYVPRLAGQRVFLGEDMLTQGFEIRAREVGQFYSTQWDDAQREALLRHFQVGYVVFGPPERELGSYNPSVASFLSRVYDADGVEIYAVKGVGEGGMRTATLPKEGLP